MRKYFYVLFFGLLITCQDEPAESSDNNETSENTAEEFAYRCL